MSQRNPAYLLPFASLGFFDLQHYDSKFGGIPKGMARHQPRSQYPDTFMCECGERRAENCIDLALTRIMAQVRIFAE